MPYCREAHAAYSLCQLVRHVREPRWKLILQFQTSFQMTSPSQHLTATLWETQSAVKPTEQRVGRLAFCPEDPSSQSRANRSAEVAQELRSGHFPLPWPWPASWGPGAVQAGARSRTRRLRRPRAHARLRARSLGTRKCEGEESHVGGARAQVAWGSLSRWLPRSRWNRRCWRRSSLTWVSSLTTRPRTMWRRNERPTRARGAAGCRCWRPWPTWPRPRRSITASPTWGRN